jgi:quercetin dioxygenase-like cupin family protein
MKQKLDEIIKYQEGVVASKTLIKKDVGNITLFAFDKGEGLSEHTVPFDAFLYIVDGSAEITIAGDANTLKKGDSIIMPANQPHKVLAVEKFKMLLVMIKEV